METSVFIIKPPAPEELGKYVVLVTRGGMMGGQMAFVADSIEYATDVEDRPTVVSLLDKDGEVVTAFPFGIPYQVVRRSQVEFLTAIDAAKRQKDEEDAVNALWKPEKDAEKAAIEAQTNKQYL